MNNQSLSGENSSLSGRKGFRIGSETFLIFGALGMMLILIVPLRPVIIDTLLAFNIGVSLIVLLVALGIRKTLDFSVFPSLLLIITLLRLSVNISTTRLILLEGSRGAEGVSAIVGTVGKVAAGGSLIVGAVVFLVLIVVNFVVITKGAGRVAEVAARFTLDALPGKQMSIDADLAAGLIGEEEARSRRRELVRESEFFGAMDGAGKFVRGDAIAGLVITAINIIGGFTVGMLTEGLSAAQAAQTYTILTMGDGLITQIPAVLVSSAAGMVVTRVSSEENLGDTMAKQVIGKTSIVTAVGIGLIMLSLLPGMPFFPILFLAIGGVLLSRSISLKGEEMTEEIKPDKADDSENLEDILALDTLEVRVGYSLLPLIDVSRGGQLPGRVMSLRKQLAEDFGIVLPPVHLTDDLSIQPEEYRVKLRGMVIAGGVAYADRLMVLDPSGNLPKVDGIQAVEPAFGLPAVWIKPSDRIKAESDGATVIDTPSVVTTHLSELLKKYAYELIGRQEVQDLLANISKQAPKLLEDVVPNAVSLGELVQVIRRLLQERVSVRDLRMILEAVADASTRSKEVSYLVEQARRRLYRQISTRVTEGTDTLHALSLSRTSEEILRAALGQQDGEQIIAPDVNIAKKLIEGVQNHLVLMTGAGRPPVILAPPDLRRPLYTFLSRFVPELFVVSAQELAPGISLESSGIIDVGENKSIPYQRAATEDFSGNDNKAKKFVHKENRI